MDLLHFFFFFLTKNGAKKAGSRYRRSANVRMMDYIPKNYEIAFTLRQYCTMKFFFFYYFSAYQNIERYVQYTTGTWVSFSIKSEIHHAMYVAQLDVLLCSLTVFSISTRRFL